MITAINTDNLLKRFPSIEPFNTGMLQVDDIHVIYYEQSGNPDGEPIIFLHGGPGANTKPKHREWFNPNHYRIILLDQRGCGQSVPFGETKNNTTNLLVSDIEKLREKLNLGKVHIFGGSWGSTLSLYYAIKHPEQVLSLIISGIFTMSKKEIDWFTNGVKAFFPKTWETMINHLDAGERKNIIKSYYNRINGGDEDIALAAGNTWRTYEGETCSILTFPEKDGSAQEEEEESEEESFLKSKIMIHYLENNMFSPDDYILQNANKIKHIPTTIIQGECDVVCPIETAYELHKSLPDAEFITIPNAGHSSSDPLTTHELIKATNKLINNRK